MTGQRSLFIDGPDQGSREVVLDTNLTVTGMVIGQFGAFNEVALHPTALDGQTIAECP